MIFYYLNYKIIILEFANRQDAVTMVEYAIMLGLIAVVSIVMVTTVGTEVSTTFSIISTSIEGANNP